MELHMNLRNTTKTCYRFETRDDSGNLTTLYLKKTDVDAASIDPNKGIIVTVQEGTGHAEG